MVDMPWNQTKPNPWNYLIAYRVQAITCHDFNCLRPLDWFAKKMFSELITEPMSM